MAVFLLWLCGSAWGGARTPFDSSWEKETVLWDFRREALVCHGGPIQLVGEEEPEIQVGSDAQGRPVMRRFRLLTYRCDDGKHVVRVWLERDIDLVREVSCHGTLVCANKGYDEKTSGNVLRCPDPPDGHRLVLKGTAREGR